VQHTQQSPGLVMVEHGELYIRLIIAVYIHFEDVQY